tara:strand:+ start:654 stop:863 length:210 start_codon:yes stop_codon:yes gene_type:complete
MTYAPILPNPIEWNGTEIEKCTLCHNDLTTEEILDQDNDLKYCNDCFFSCCGDELDQDNRRCPTCKEHN